jgi:hypothetical protein
MPCAPSLTVHLCRPTNQVWLPTWAQEVSDHGSGAKAEAGRPVRDVPGRVVRRAAPHGDQDAGPPLPPHPSCSLARCGTHSCRGERARVLPASSSLLPSSTRPASRRGSGDVRRSPYPECAGARYQLNGLLQGAVDPLPLEPIAPIFPSRLRLLIACAPCSQVLPSRGSTSMAAPPPPPHRPLPRSVL